MARQQPIVAFLYDFDKTLCTTDMQNYAFIPSLGMTPAEFWAMANGFGRANRIDGILAYMYTMIQEAERKNLPFTRQDLVEKGRSIRKMLRPFVSMSVKEKNTLSFGIVAD